MLIKYETPKKVMEHLGRSYNGCKRLTEIARANNIATKKDGSKIMMVASEEIIKNNHYKEFDIYELGQSIELDNHKWTIKTITKKSSKLYHCENELGFRGSFDCLQLKRGILI